MELERRIVEDRRERVCDGRRGHPKLKKIGQSAEDLLEDIERYRFRHLGRSCSDSASYAYKALAYAMRDRLMEDWQETQEKRRSSERRVAHYLSLEFLIGRALGNHALNMDIEGRLKEAVCGLGYEMEELAEQEEDAGLGNGGLGRLAACFMESSASMGLPVIGHGIRYRYGMFRQKIEGGWQVEEPDNWLREGNPWEIERAEFSCRVRFGGLVSHWKDRDGVERSRWEDTRDVLALPYDMPVPGYRNQTVNTLRLWSAVATDDFDLGQFNGGGYAEAVRKKNEAEQISMVLYPNDASENGKELRLRQQYFLVAASLSDAIRQWKNAGGSDIRDFAKKNVFQMNDTHPALAVAELMRALVDEERVPWDEAWQLARDSLAYTNHTLMPEALETWPVRFFEKLLPRHLEIIYEINAKFLREVAMRWPGDVDRLRRMSIIQEGDEKRVRMAWLAIVGSFSVNGVAHLHSELLKQGLFADFFDLWPEKFGNKTNGVSPRRWVAGANKPLSSLITETVGDGWQNDMGRLEGLRAWADRDDAAGKEFRSAWMLARKEAKERLCDLILAECGVEFSPAAMISAQVKRVHEYKRQLLNVLHAISLYEKIKRGGWESERSRCVLLGGKAAPGYWKAKKIIRLANAVAEVINTDPATSGKLRMAFLPNYRVSSMEIIAPGTDLSEQISLAGMEASGTGNMKFMMNGALTIGTLDGANIEIMGAVGEQNFFRFGLSAQEAAQLRGHWDPRAAVEKDECLRAALWLLEAGHFSGSDVGLFGDILDGLLSQGDPWLTLADFKSYAQAQEAASLAWADQDRWAQMSIRNVAASGVFSSDRTIGEYNREIWRLDRD